MKTYIVAFFISFSITCLIGTIIVSRNEVNKLKKEIDSLELDLQACQEEGYRNSIK